jgi:hypothetical protein
MSDNEAYSSSSGEIEEDGFISELLISTPPQQQYDDGDDDERKEQTPSQSFLDNGDCEGTDLSALLAVNHCKCAPIGDLPLTDQWPEVEAFLVSYQDRTFQNFSRGNSKTVKACNKTVIRESKKRPESLKYYSIILQCIHRERKKKKKACSDGNEATVEGEEGDDKKKVRYSYDTGCKAFISLSTYYDKKSKIWRFQIIGCDFTHNHAVSENIYKQYPRQRSIPESPVIRAVAELGVSNVDIQSMIMEEHNVALRLKDIKNYKSFLKKEYQTKVRQLDAKRLF